MVNLLEGGEQAAQSLEVNLPLCGQKYLAFPFIKVFSTHPQADSFSVNLQMGGEQAAPSNSSKAISTPAPAVPASAPAVAASAAIGGPAVEPPGQTARGE